MPRQTCDEVHNVNSRVRDALKRKGAARSTRHRGSNARQSDLTDAQKRDERFYLEAAEIVFNQNSRGGAGCERKARGHLKSEILVEVGREFITVANKLLSHVSIYQPREVPIAQGDRLHLKANRKLVRGGRFTNGEIVTVKSGEPNGEVELSDGRVLDKNVREFRHQRGVRIFTPDKEQLRDNLSRSGHRLLALEFTAGLFGRCDGRLWNRLSAFAPIRTACRRNFISSKGVATSLTKQA